MIQPQKRMGVESIWDIAFDYLLRYLASDFSAFEPAVLLKCLIAHTITIPRTIQCFSTLLYSGKKCWIEFEI